MAFATIHLPTKVLPTAVFPVQTEESVCLSLYIINKLFCVDDAETFEFTQLHFWFKKNVGGVLRIFLSTVPLSKHPANCAT